MCPTRALGKAWVVHFDNVRVRECSTARYRPALSRLLPPVSPASQPATPVCAPATPEAGTQRHDGLGGGGGGQQQLGDERCCGWWRRRSRRTTPNLPRRHIPRLCESKRESETDFFRLTPRRSDLDEHHEPNVTVDVTLATSPRLTQSLNSYCKIPLRECRAFALPLQR